MNQPFKIQKQQMPDIYLSGETVEAILSLCNNAIIFAKSQDGSMRPFIDPTPIAQILGAAVAMAQRPEGENAV
jgi:hypothetical protein